VGAVGLERVLLKRPCCGCCSWSIWWGNAAVL